MQKITKETRKWKFLFPRVLELGAVFAEICDGNEWEIKFYRFMVGD
jgi:hypothetical protein